MNNTRIIGLIASLLIIGFLAWYFSNIVIYFIIAMVLTMIGQPIVRLLGHIHVGRLRIPHSLSCLLALLFIILIFASFFIIFVPLGSHQAALISRIDVDSVNQNMQNTLIRFDQILQNAGLLKEDQTIITLINNNIVDIVNIERVKGVFNNLLSFAGSFVVGIFSILFITFFMLKNSHLVLKTVLLIVPQHYHTETNNVFRNTNRLLSRYFIGISIEVMTMVILISVGLSIFNIPNAILIGFLGGCMNIIPYLGPLIGASVGVLLGVTNVLSTGGYDQIFLVIVTVLGTFLGANLIDNLILQPFIYSSSVKSHPLEIFVVLLMGGSIAGIIGMVLAIPTYTVIRVIAKEFMGRFRIVQKLTERI
ncbi:MAG: AI-2E family transporter [Bacteroidales bacterium]|nr:AI-2E family transporter [Bacteroidales bacterium]MDZ4203500.1 AI-2E family transporter [Bacteroidales bacterium]